VEDPPQHKLILEDNMTQVNATSIFLKLKHHFYMLIPHKTR